MMESVEVYETSDLPEADQAILAARDDSAADSIETLHITANEAFGRFKGSYIDSHSVDFSDKLRTSRRKGYNVVWSGEAPKEEETPLKKYQRLNCEARELQEELVAARTSQESGLSDATLETISEQVEVLHKQLVQLRLEEVLGERTLSTMTDPQAAAQQKLLSQLEQLKTAPGASAGGSGGGAVGEGNTASYSLSVRAVGRGAAGESLLAELEQRLTALEAGVGLSQEAFSVLCMETNKKTVTQAVQVLSAKTSLLDPYYLDHVEGRLSALQQKLGALTDHKSELDSEAKGRLDSLLAVAEKSQPLYTSLPDTVQRMETLQNLHMQAATFSRSLVELETVQEQLTAQLGNNLSLLSATKAQFPANMAGIQQNFSSLFSRIERLQKVGKK